MSWISLGHSRSPYRDAYAQPSSFDGKKDTKVKTVHLRSHAWEGDRPSILRFPEEWNLQCITGNTPRRLGGIEITAALRSPIGAPSLAELAAKRTRAVILIDDLSRPTPTAEIIPYMVRELESGGMSPDAVTILVAGGTHSPVAGSVIEKKVGEIRKSGVRICIHDSRGDLVSLGRSRRGTPVSVNRTIADADLRVSIGSLTPHPAAGYSGGAKNLVPGACGSETIRILHSRYHACRVRGGSLECEFRVELEDVARQIGLDWVVNLVLGPAREIVGLYAGDMEASHRAGVRRAREIWSVKTVPEADIVITDFYPFDGTLQFGHDRGVWPLFTVNRRASRVVLAASPFGVGSHELFPVEESLAGKVGRRLKTFRPGDLPEMLTKIRRLREMVRERTWNVLVMSPHLSEEQVRAVFPGGMQCADWECVLRVLRSRHGGRRTNVAIYQCAPFLVPIT